jgi:DNA-binding NtrC family response regulator
MKRILIVDDEKEITDFLGLIVKDLGNDIEVTVENSWSDAISIIEEAKQPFDLVITDFCMPRRRQGLPVIAAARRNAVSTKVILMSSDATAQDKVDANPDRFIAKPFDLRAFIATINELLPPA